MNPDTGRMHSAMTEEESERQRKLLEKLTSKVVAKQARLAEDVPEAELKKGDPIPSDWPQFEVGEMIPIKGFHFKLERIEHHDGGPARLVLRHHGMTKAEKRRRGR